MKIIILVAGIFVVFVFGILWPSSTNPARTIDSVKYLTVAAYRRGYSDAINNIDTTRNKQIIFDLRSAYTNDSIIFSNMVESTLDGK